MFVSQALATPGLTIALRSSLQRNKCGMGKVRHSLLPALEAQWEMDVQTGQVSKEGSDVTRETEEVQCGGLGCAGFPERLRPGTTGMNSTRKKQKDSRWREE